MKGFTLVPRGRLSGERLTVSDIPIHPVGKPFADM